MDLDVKCPCCQKPSRSRGRIPDGISFAGRTLNEPLEGGFLFCCTRCSLNFRWPRVPTEVLDQLYIDGEEGHWEDPWEQRKDWILAREQLESSDSNLEKTILDVGCFDGSFLRFLGCDWRRSGIEINPLAAKKAERSGIEIIGDDLANLDQFGSSFGAVVATDVIEHVPNPLLFLTGMAKLTQKNGLVIISTGNTQAWTWKLAGSRYWYCVIPEHISFINPAWCHQAAETLGLKLKSLRYFSHAPDSKILTSTVQILANMAYIYMPSAICWLRRSGWGKTDIRQNPALGDFPPSWMSARDQLLVTFEKQ